jgi:uncharacterized protein
MNQFKTILLISLLSANLSLFGQTDSIQFSETPIVLKTPNGEIHGLLCLPKPIQDKKSINKTQFKVALIIAGSGPTDLNGNNPSMVNNSLMYLAHQLAINQIASVRYDKRGIASSAAAGKKEEDLRFDDYVNDAKLWVNLLNADQRFSKTIVIGHSEGSLIGMMVADSADKFISIAGSGIAADALIKKQLATQPKAVQDLCYPYIDSLKAGKFLKNVEPALYSLFRPSVQGYMISWFKYDPAVEINKLNIPILLLQGDKDLQVGVENVKILNGQSKNARMYIILKMNHVMKIIEGDEKENLAAYSNRTLGISTFMTDCITTFIFFQ